MSLLPHNRASVIGDLGNIVKIGKHFSLKELTVSETAARKGIANVPSEEQICNLQALVHNVLDPLRERLGVPVLVTSGFRCVELNEAVGGVPTSQHCLGQAADIHVNGLSIRELADKIRDLNLPFDQLIDEFGAWVHVSYGPRQRREALVLRKVNGRSVFTEMT